ncbi:MULTISPECIES: class A beta-lactamase [unclassified Rhizobium]|jgi:beta-lactamase class A|uniref:class A beta-lactamase n=1 Tax=unclassified Rhizobium TaxID=2613769 RepID=UPI00064917BE|nr:MULTISPECIES: class A beta-lactamase [unclassified Rhizobium]MBN8951170.1 class A beta-lactamase [Rhizobium tropici]OJY69091.1 MAG: class A beta-lactamase [Rhizobium sp. 60-20]RKD74121.1 beta-lactamase class A [Rhizobium sp. WW_1]
MPTLLTRRRLMAGSALLLPALTLGPDALFAQDSGATPQTPPATDSSPAPDTSGQGTEGGAQDNSQLSDDVDKQLADLEKRTGGRLGVSVLDTETNISLGHREEERFPLCSTYKALAVGFVLARVDQGVEKLDRRVTYGKDKVVTYSPATEKHADADGMTIAELCGAAITLSDNTAGNLLLDSFGGPAALTSWLRTTGDTETRLDRNEPDVNQAVKDDPRDTTTPDAILDTIGLLTLGNTLSETSRDQFVNWLVANTTGNNRLRAGLPNEWKVGDKTGTGNNGSYADIAVIWPPERGAILVTTFVAEATAPAKDVESVFAEVSKIVVGMIGQ